jgi:hypothetical protein
MDNVIEHLANPVTLLEHVHTLLTPTGKLIVITPNMHSGNYRLLGRRWTPELSPHTHIYLFTHDPLTQLLQQTGFAVQRRGNFHLPIGSVHEWFGKLRSGAIKHFVWTGMQEAGSIYGRLVGQGPMLYAIACPSGS